MCWSLLCLVAFAGLWDEGMAQVFRDEKFERKLGDFFRDLLQQELRGRLKPELRKAADGVCGATEYLYFEFTTNATEAEVKERFKDLRVFYGFKVFGTGQYIYVVKNDQNLALRKLRLPSDAIRTVTTFALETADNFLSNFDIRQKIGGPPRLLSGPDLTFTELIWTSRGLSETQFKASLTEHVLQVQKDPLRLNGVALVPVGLYPPRFMFFWNLRDCDLAEILFHNNDATGGPGCLKARTMKIFDIYAKRSVEKQRPH